MAGLEDHDDAARLAYLAEGNARQARKRVAVDVLIRDDNERVLLVNPSYKDYWDLPGGMAESNESPTVAAKRELQEELGIGLAVGRLLLLDWVGPHGPWDDQLLFIFDGGTLTPGEVENIRILDDELTEFVFVKVDDCERLLRPDIWRLLQSSYRCLGSERTEYFETTRP